PPAVGVRALRLRVARQPDPLPVLLRGSPHPAPLLPERPPSGRPDRGLRDLPPLREVARPLAGRAPHPRGGRAPLDRDGLLGCRPGIHSHRARTGRTLGNPESVEQTLEGLRGVQRSLRSRFEDFRRALERRDEEAYRVALADFHAWLKRWTEAEERVLLFGVVRAGIAGRDPWRELRLNCIQVRELARFLLEEVTRRAVLSDILGLVENLDRRLAAYESEMDKVYFP